MIAIAGGILMAAFFLVMLVTSVELMDNAQGPGLGIAMMIGTILLMCLVL
jgi:hypothetical protein